jgi:hypothetical protein
VATTDLVSGPLVYWLGNRANYRPRKCGPEKDPDQEVKEWKERWQREVDKPRVRYRGPAEEAADEPLAKERLKLHDGLHKVESFLLIQNSR